MAQLSIGSASLASFVTPDLDALVYLGCRGGNQTCAACKRMIILRWPRTIDPLKVGHDAYKNGVSSLLRDTRYAMKIYLSNKPE